MLAAASLLKVTMSIQILGISTPPHMLTYTYCKSFVCRRCHHFVIAEGITAAVATYDGSGMLSAGFGGDGASRVVFSTIRGKRLLRSSITSSTKRYDRIYTAAAASMTKRMVNGGWWKAHDYAQNAESPPSFAIC
ncbi:hypothetical protein EGR_11050 [Echinococcus granulosus]|uniref:Uncharacterized protein n=1 Tax=Echinococcus granulosus TaxID=6210 RepID=W6TZ70_ECHGR|nr:hypothetical protein EGR_11050 [Echinococcus granulosus]EUB54090.1 hypothetical protein EGR_11050 [Echinococcus granulosus]